MRRVKCVSCAFESPAGFKFCGACGTPFAGAPAPAVPAPAQAVAHAAAPSSPDPRSDERRTVTILFCDISGFTAMSEKLDPEAVQEVMDRAFERLTAVITGYGGTIDKYIGDAIMALFGAPVALGDDPERAVRAGLGMQKVMAEYAEELKRTRGFGLAMRVGINTGKVIWGRVGGAGEKQFTVMGDAVNLASRLEHAAPIGGVLLGESTQRHVRTRFSLEALDPIQVKGKAEPQRVYRVLGEVSAPARATMLGPRTPFVGRDEEMAEFSGLFDAIKGEAATGAVVTLEAPAGTGKSRMVLELRADSDDRGLSTFAARAAPFGHGAPFAPWTDLVQRAAGIGGLAPAAARERVRGWIQENGADSEVDPRWIDELGGIAEISDPEVQRRREQPARFRQGLLDALITWLWASAKQRPLMLLAEDLHWWPAPALELLGGAAQVARKAPLLLVATRRPEPLAGPWETEPGDRVITLGPLDAAALSGLAQGVLGADAPPGLMQRLESVTAGNPFFAEEVIQAYIDKGALRTSPERGGWSWDEALAQQVDLPMTVEGVTQARIDSLPPRERRVLQMAAVAGRTFWEGLIQAMGEPDPGETLSHLAARDLVHTRRSRLPGEKEYAFKHATIQAVAYENALKRERLTDHRRVADWLESRTGEAATELETTIAEHYLLAEEPTRALPHLIRAAEEAVRVFARLEDAVVVEQSVATAEAVDHPKFLGQALRLRGRLRRIAGHSDAEKDLRRALELAESQSDSLGIAIAGRELGGVMLQRGLLSEAKTIATKSLSAAREIGSTRIEVVSLNQLGNVAWRDGDLELAMRRYEEALSLAEKQGASDQVGLLLIAIGTVNMESGELRGAIRSFKRAIEMDISPENMVILRSNLGGAHLEAGDFEASTRELGIALQEAERIGLRFIHAEALIRRGAVISRKESSQAGMNEIDRGIALARSVDAAEPLIEGLWRRAELLRSIDPDSSERDLLEARSLAGSRGDKTALARIEKLISELPTSTEA